ncbi:hypothetical protein [Franconibacter helveticus]|uniref:hypothetical protein n=1 Tax=Franconibacter helveticus TaxID=357240 RepID=UPI00131EECD3|nr:hypothetical protein [Franconibacter helveticus]
MSRRAIFRPAVTALALLAAGCAVARALDATPASFFRAVSPNAPGVTGFAR